MFKHGLYWVWGLSKVASLFIIFFVLLGFYFWGEKAKEVAAPWIAESREKGALFYAEGIWSRMTGVQSKVDNQNDNALELIGNTKRVEDNSGRYSLEVLESWKVEQFGGAKMILSSPKFSELQDGATVSVENGARLTIQIAKSEQSSAKSSDGGHGSNLIRKEDVLIEGISGSYHVIKDPSVKKGQVIDAHIIFKGHTYFFRYVFNPERYRNGEFVLQEIFASFKLK